jgi:hypothetical protein
MGLFDNLFKKATEFVTEQAKNLENQFEKLKENIQDFAQQNQDKESEIKPITKTEQNTNTSTHTQVLNGDDFSFTTSKGENVTNSSKIIDRRMGNMYLDIVTLPEKGNKEYLRVQDVKFVGGVDIEQVIVTHIALNEIGYLDIDTQYQIVKFKANQSRQRFKPTGMEDSGSYLGEIMLFYANKDEFTTFVTEKLLPNLEKKSVKNELCKALNIRLESDNVVDNSPRVFQSFGDNQLKSEGLPHDSNLDIYDNYQNSYTEKYYLLQENHFQVEEYFYIRNNNASPYNLYSASKIIFYYEDMRGLAYNYDGYLTINGKAKQCYFTYEYKTDAYSLSQGYNEWLLLVTSKNFDIKDLEEKLKQKIEDSAMVLLLDDEKLPNMTEKIVFSTQYPQGISEKLFGTPNAENLVFVESDDEKTADIADVLFGENKGTYNTLFEIVGNKIYKGEVAEENLILINLTHNWLDEDLTGSVVVKLMTEEVLKFNHVTHQNETISYETVSKGSLDIYPKKIGLGGKKEYPDLVGSSGLVVNEGYIHKYDIFPENSLVMFRGVINEENQLFIMEVLNESLYYQYSYKYPMSELKDVYESGTPISKQQQEENRNVVTNNTNNTTKKEDKKEEKEKTSSSSNAKAKNIAIKVKNDTGEEMNVYNQGSGGNYRLQKNIITTIKMDEGDKLYEYNNAKKGRLLLTAEPSMDGKVFLISKL